MACVTIWLSSMAAMAGASHPLELRTSTHAWMRRMALPTMSSVSCCSSADSWMRERCACSSTLAFVCGSLNLAPPILCGSFVDRFLFETRQQM